MPSMQAFAICLSTRAVPQWAPQRPAPTREGYPRSGYSFVATWRGTIPQRASGGVMKIEYDSYSLGFSNRTWDETLRILDVFRIQRLVDIRTLPGSKHTPQFNLEHLV